MTNFEETFRAAYGFDAPALTIGHVLQDDGPNAELPIRIPLAMMNRHGLIAGSTGTGKTRTLQLLAEELSRNGVPVFLADVKGDLAGLARAGEINERVATRLGQVGLEPHPEAFPVEFFSLTGQRGIQLRATVSSFGPVLLGKVLDLTDVQQSVLAMVFKYCDDRQMPLLDFSDLREVLQYLAGVGKGELKEYGGMSGATVGVLLRKMVELEQQGAARFFGEPELEIDDLMRTDGGRGVINVLSLADVQDKPRLWSTFLMWLLGQFYYRMPEVGDAPKPKLVFFFDEAHLLFDDASSALVEHIEQVARLIRSKGVGVFFVTQTPKDVAEDVLAQLGNRIQHAIRAFTPKDAKNLKATASTFPISEHYAIDKTLTSMGIGEALVTVLDPRGIPTAVAVAQILPPSSSMTAIGDEDYAEVIGRSALASKYEHAIDRESAREILARKLASSVEQEEEAPAPKRVSFGAPVRFTAAKNVEPPRTRSRSTTSRPAPSRGRQEKGLVEEVLGSPAAKQVGKQVV
ncbi:MAG TPA: helicase HerA-like domain-containing protein, partial [Thermoanaerobaculia bacterium]|nr:helicase HerA-like domain-containing protein [Thermoanaerobaculia bacterium]